MSGATQSANGTVWQVFNLRKSEKISVPSADGLRAITPYTGENTNHFNKFILLNFSQRKNVLPDYIAIN